ERCPKGLLEWSEIGRWSSLSRCPGAPPRGQPTQADFLQDVTSAERGFRALLDELVAAERCEARDRPGDREHRPALVERRVGGDERARPRCGLDADGRRGQT